MSLWFTFRDREGRWKRLSFTCDPLALLGLVAVVVALCLPITRRLRELCH